MDILRLPAAARYSNTPPPYSAVKQHLGAATTSFFILASELSQDSSVKTSAGLRRPTTQNPKQTSSTENPLKTLTTSRNTPTSPPSNRLSNKLRLSSKLSPPPPDIPVLSLEETLPVEYDDGVLEHSEENEKEMGFREKGKIFVGNLPLWIKKSEVAEFFRQFGPIKNVVLIKGYDDVERNMGFGFVLYDGLMAEKAAMKAVEFDGVEFHGRVLTVKLDNGRRTKEKMAERVRWVEGSDEDRNELRSKWHEERNGSRREFQRVLETQPDNWQAVVGAFERIKKVNILFLGRFRFSLI